MKYLLVLNVLLLFTPLDGQTVADTTNPFSIAPNVLPLRDWHKFSYSELQLNYNTLKPGIMDYYTPPVIPENPFLIDMRDHPMYTPRFVSDELNLIMNRPRDNAFVPILGVAFLAMQLAQKHLLISEITAITPRDILVVPEGIEVLDLLWDHAPQRAAELYRDSTLSEEYTMVLLEDLLTKMTDNKLVRKKTVENEPALFFPALTRQDYIELINRGIADSTLTASEQRRLHELRRSPFLTAFDLNPAKKE